MGLFSGKQNQRENEVKHYEVRITIPNQPAVKMGYYASNKNEAKGYALADFPSGKVSHIKQK